MTQATARNQSPGSLRLFEAFGINVYIHWSWFVLLLLVPGVAARLFGGDLVWGALALGSLFGIVLLHEFGHALACRSVGGRADHIVLWPLGGIAFVQPPPRPGPTLWTIAAGPLVNVLLIPVTLLLWSGVQMVPALAAIEHLERLAFAITAINILLLVFNMLPIYPLDGGQILQSLLWFAIGRARALFVAASIGMVGAIGGGAAAYLILGDWWLLLIALFVGLQSWDGLRMARAMRQAEGMRGRDIFEPAATDERG